MQQTDDLQSGPQSRPAFEPTLSSHILFTFSSALALLVLFALMRLALLTYNHESIGATPVSEFVEAFINGARFDLRLIAFICVPLVLSLLSVRAMAARHLQCAWLTVAASLCLFLGVVELNFYREFHQRLNSLVFQYLQEDLKTVLSMIWYGFPVVRLLLAWLVATLLLAWLFCSIERVTRPGRPSAAVVLSPGQASAWYRRGAVFVVCLLITVVAVRGTVRHGPPLRWGDAYTTESMFANHLGLNGTLTLVDAAKNTFSDHRDNTWESSLPEGEALEMVRSMLLTSRDQLVDADVAAVRRTYTPAPETRLPGVRNVVVILMESMAGRYIGALGSADGITPNFDALAKEGLLFTRFFSNGTHTHQGMFATMACFPNLPAFEYLMRMPEGSHKFSGLPQMLSPRGYEDVYVYNGSFAWDNQAGFFSNQGMTSFVGRDDFVNPVFIDPTWGVSDQDMFARSAQELSKLEQTGKPFYALLQTLSNHTPYALPKDLPVEPVTGHGSLDQHLTAMRYADWSLGQFFAEARKQPYFKDTLFVILGDHGFGAPEQLTEMDLFRFNVPLLLIGPGVSEKFGHTIDRVGSQVDVVPTILGRLGEPAQHQCWGRDLLDLAESDQGEAVIKPSGGEQTVAIVSGDTILVKPKDLDARLYRYTLGPTGQARLINDQAKAHSLQHKLDAFLQVATQSLLANTTGAVSPKPVVTR
ncbi:phosphoglycerol transferase MdoB-like AlkP superfamily enzyme [Pseudomonas duriflava]|uniref:Phosphoglycerol transferase MdoB-like AlkP superfamily enzyme n=1 Tax=Pseudomonas duriflava TaxID=459528 RepID=A0A562QAT8_9PSED|nr:LTA synthase family protein [Pseudomonas duriflava]TWI53867.1 phosphoglycerol transferase MdoB-like AlkP superfamily enzyme [Pseudomonas duriflava]